MLGYGFLTLCGFRHPRRAQCGKQRKASEYNRSESFPDSLISPE
jgi:hypothetical protein